MKGVELEVATARAQQINLNSYRNARYVSGSAAPAAQPRPKRKEPVKRPKVVRKTQAQLKAETRRSTVSAVKVMLVSALLFGLIFVQIYSQLRLDELDQELNTINSQISVIESDNTRMTMEIDSNISLSKVDEYATNTLGMVKVSDYQVNYVQLSDEDTVVVSGGKTHQSLIDKIKSIF